MFQGTKLSTCLVNLPPNEGLITRCFGASTGAHCQVAWFACVYSNVIEGTRSHILNGYRNWPGKEEGRKGTAGCKHISRDACERRWMGCDISHWIIENVAGKIDTPKLYERGWFFDDYADVVGRMRNLGLSRHMIKALWIRFYTDMGAETRQNIIEPE